MLRRSLLTGLGSTVAASATLRASEARSPAGIIDVHAHFTPPDYIRALSGTKLLQPPTLGWSINKHLAAMDQAGVARSILSLTTPGIPVGDVARARALARSVNEYAASLVGRYPGQIGMFTTLPMPDIEGSLAEIAFGFSRGASGVGLFTSYQGKWLGNPEFDPLLEDLNRRKAIVYVHPTAPGCCSGLLPYIQDAIIEYGTDTTRAITSLIYTGAARRYPDIRFIFSHAGGTMPFLIERFDMSDRSNAIVRERAPEGFRATARRFFYDTAQSSNDVAMGALRKVVPTSQILFGTDYPFRSMQEHVERLRGCGCFDHEELVGILSHNARHVFA